MSDVNSPIEKSESTRIHPAIVQTISRVVESYGVNFHDLLSEIHVDLAVNTRVRGSVIEKIWRASLEKTKDDAIGVKFAEHFQIGSLSGLGFSWITSNTLLDGFERISRFFGVISNAGKIVVKESNDSISISLVLPVPYGIAEDAGVDAALALFVQLCRLARGQHFNPQLVRFQRPEPTSTEAFNSFFQCPIEYSAAQNTLSFDKTEVQMSLPVANPDLARANDQVVIDYLRQHEGENTTGKVSSLIIEALPSGTPSLQGVAEQLFVSTKTLQRRLSSEGIMFSALLDDIRLKLANNYLRQPWRSIGEICYLLGFSEPSNFTRWYKGETGKSPIQYRETEETK